jgi:hypothetical protein
MGTRLLLAMTTVVLSWLASEAAACDLRLEPSSVFGGSCQVLVGYYNGQRIGPFHISAPDGSHITAGTCDAFIQVTGINANVVDVQPFHSLPAGQYTLGVDCRSAVKTR